CGLRGAGAGRRRENRRLVLRRGRLRAEARSGHEVFAADSEPAAVAALAHAAATAPGLRKLDAETRDLFRRPLRAQELAAFDAALIDPPRAGALDQARALAASTLPLVVSISCNPA